MARISPAPADRLAEFARKHLAASGWTPGVHVP